jgi:hypothetical protein
MKQLPAREAARRHTSTVKPFAAILESAMRREALGAAIALAVITIVTLVMVRRLHSTVALTGVVLRQDSDPRKQLPISDTEVTASNGEQTAQGKTDASGMFLLKLPNRAWRERAISLEFRHRGYQTLEMTAGMAGHLYVARMTPTPGLIAAAGAHEVAVKDVRIRYSEKTTSRANVGSIAKTFTVPNPGDVACANRPPCSPDGEWKASMGGVKIDAGQGQQFQNARVSCIAGPCAFTKIESGAAPPSGPNITVKVRNWSDTATFLVEAEVTRDMPVDAIRQDYPAIYGRSMDFTLPASAEGPSIEADLGGQEIVFPLGPALQLSWAACTLESGAGQNKLYRCELKPGYQFQ